MPPSVAGATVAAAIRGARTHAGMGSNFCWTTQKRRFSQPDAVRNKPPSVALQTRHMEHEHSTPCIRNDSEAADLTVLLPCATGNAMSSPGSRRLQGAISPSRFAPMCSAHAETQFQT